jgi:hypothetical protein
MKERLRMRGFLPPDDGSGSSSYDDELGDEMPSLDDEE